MINYINGIVKEKTGQQITLAIGPVGLAIQVPNESLFQIGDESCLYVHLHCNQ